MLIRAGAVLTGVTAAVLAATAMPAAACGFSFVGKLPIKAVDYPTHRCEPDIGGGPYQGKDVWVFELPAYRGHHGDFRSVTVKFDTDGDRHSDKTIVIDDGANDGDDIVKHGGTSRAWIVTPAGWKLTGASAKINGKAPKFTLGFTCPGTTPPPPTPTPTYTKPPVTTPPTTAPPTTAPPTTAPPTVTPTTSAPKPTPTDCPPSVKPTPSKPTHTYGKPTPTPTKTTAVPMVTYPSSSGTSTSLPVTGSGLSALILLAGGLVGTGAGALFLARRRAAGRAS
ncbi:hypothetical protein GCM10010123_41270 [Pilimelia anulata]|uniref:Gram-positive cocci surface proteins LPxTG domain-containing protein n=1 Tax=Pilimelia anulata TaxID=53371 RepID=A0A8J3BDN3_9ACTN|nr:hypothetical protein [Pilimelia anulata]GGK07183.1 hypothetical protein GCM10010123_41270 [Pilimelia anulata]